MTLLEVRDVSKRFGGLLALQKVHCTIEHRTFQMVRPFLNLTTWCNVVMAASFGQVPTPSRRQAEQSAWYWLEFIGLADKAPAPAHSLSLGERKRLEIARALATQPHLLLDEAIAGLNPTEVSQIMHLIREIQGIGVTIFLIEHVMKAVLGLSDKVIVLNYGEKIAEGPPQVVASDPQVIAAYLGQKRPS
jgi:branched-chain amino acid transport system ATP-binding protein